MTSPLAPPSFSAGMDALTIGYLVGDAEKSCVGISDQPNKAYSSDGAIKWPAGIEARTDPVRLLDENGRVIARAGDIVHLRGGSGPADLSPQAPCTERPRFIVNEIIKVIPADEH